MKRQKNLKIQIDTNKRSWQSSNVGGHKYKWVGFCSQRFPTKTNKISLQENIKFHIKRKLISYQKELNFHNKRKLDCILRKKKCWKIETNLNPICCVCFTNLSSFHNKTIKNCHKFVPQISAEILAVSALCGVEARGFVPLKPPLIQFTIFNLYPVHSNTLVWGAAQPYLCICAIKSERRLKLIVSFPLPTSASN